MDEAMIEQFNEIDLCGFQITLDGYRERHNKVRNNNGKPSYYKIIQNINLLCSKIKKISITLRINYDNQTLKKQQAENILGDIEKENRSKIQIDLQRVWQTTGNKSEGEQEVSSLINKAKGEGYRNINCAGGLAVGQYCNCYTSRYHYVEINYYGKVYKCTARDYTEPYEMGEMNDDGTIKWNEDRLSKLYGSATFENPICLKCAYLPLCWGPCPQKMVEFKEKGMTGYCVINYIERSMKERIVDMYENTINSIKRDANEA